MWYAEDLNKWGRHLYVGNATKSTIYYIDAAVGDARSHSLSLSQYAYAIHRCVLCVFVIIWSVVFFLGWYEK